MEFNIIEEYEQNKKITAKQAFLVSLKIGFCSFGKRDENISLIKNLYVRLTRILWIGRVLLVAIIGVN